MNVLHHVISQKIEFFLTRLPILNSVSFMPGSNSCFTVSMSPSRVMEIPLMMRHVAVIKRDFEVTGEGHARV
jgi:hypothetical protein